VYDVVRNDRSLVLEPWQDESHPYAEQFPLR
jgi:hypothetical protein